MDARTQHCINPLTNNAFVAGDGKTEFLCSFVKWLETWFQTSCGLFSLSKQTSGALFRTLRAQSSLVSELRAEGITFVIPRGFQSDPLKKRFAQQRQIS